MESEHVVSEEQKRVSIEKDKDLLGLNEARIQLQDEKESLGDSERTNACEDQNVNEKKRKTSKGKKEKEKKQKTRQVKSTEENISQDEGKIEEKGTDEANETPAGRVLRSRAKERNFGVEMNPCRGEERKILGTETRQKPQDFDVGSMVTKKCKTDVEYLEGREPAMLDKSSPKADQLPQETNMSSHEIDRHVDGPRPSRGVTSRKPADDTTQQPEAEVVRGLNEGNKSAQGELLLKDYKSDQGSLGLNDNRIKKVEETIVHEQEIKRAGQQLQDVDDVSAAKKQDLDSTEPVLTRQTAKSTSRDTGRSKRNGKNPAAVPAFEKTATASKENAPDGKTGRNKRKPARSVREVLTSADQQSNSDCTTSTEIPSMLDCTKKRKTLFNSRENSIMLPISDVQISFANTTLSKSRANAGIPPSLSAFMRSFIAPKLKKSH
ncbi:hypothetical protein OS493_021134 [Desmophyllum pertusum]|uniref:Uncharacterized protein n=1 Tax=Desmophyllum pertusum TaxID=174260 RepID=A0A9W9ZNE0_9CNID|nr:hypothetical protein OS493_021134 [Desmophyllum pertusum]